MDCIVPSIVLLVFFQGFRLKNAIHVGRYSTNSGQLDRWQHKPNSTERNSQNPRESIFNHINFGQYNGKFLDDTDVSDNKKYAENQ